MRTCLLLLVSMSLSGCMHQIGTNLTAGVLDTTTERAEIMVEQALLLEIGRQLGEGLTAGAADVTPEQQEALEAALDSLMRVTTGQFAEGLRDDVSPELRLLVQQGIVGPLAEGMRGPFGEALEFSVERAITAAETSVKTSINDPDLRESIAELIRASIYEALQEGRPGSPGVGETLEQTLTYNLLQPFEDSVESITDVVATRVDASTERTENTLRAVISALAVVLGVFVLMYALTRRQLNRVRQSNQDAEVDLRSLSAALSMLDEETRTRILGKAGEYGAVAGGKTAPPAPPRSDSYER